MASSATREFVKYRAGDGCEYCLPRQQLSPFTHHIEHVVARKHGGPDGPHNLALACHRCNLRKGPNLSGIDPLSNEIVPLFHPRRDGWHDHFRILDLSIKGKTPTGRATVEVLALNDVRRLELRHELVLLGAWP